MILVTEEYISAGDGIELWTATQGDGGPLILNHGGPGTRDYLSPVADMIDDLCTVHRWDQRGAGRSTKAGPYTIARFVADIEALRESFGYDSWIVAGHSWGANLSLHYALAYPQRVRALAYICGTGLNWSQWRLPYHEEEDRRLGTLVGRYRDLKKKKDRSLAEEREFLILGDVPNYADPQRAWEFAERLVEQNLEYPVSYEANAQLGREERALLEEDLTRLCRALHVPVLVIHGERDPRPAEAVQSLVEALPSCERVVIPGAGHMPWVENPSVMEKAMRGFLEGA